jgi:hypothetical protein
MFGSISMKSAVWKTVAFRSCSAEILAARVEIERSVPGSVPVAARHTDDSAKRHKPLAAGHLRSKGGGLQRRGRYQCAFA